MARDRSRKRNFKQRPESVREERKVSSIRKLLTFSFKDIDETQPSNAPQSIKSWNDEGLLKPFLERLRDLSKLTRDEACKQQKIKIYGDFPAKAKTDFFHPRHVDEHVAWGVINSVGGQKGRIAGYIVESTFYVVFLDKEHRFFISEKKNT